VKKVIPAILLALASALALFPLLVTFAGSFMTETEIMLRYSAATTVFDLASGTTRFAQMSLMPNQATLSQYLSVLFLQPSFLILLGNSAKIALPAVAGNVVVSTLAAYGFHAWKSKASDAVFAVYVVVMLMPLQAVIVPNYIIADTLGIKDSYLAIILPGIFSPFGAFLIKQAMKSLDPACFEAASADGAGHFTLFLRIFCPQMKSAMAALAMLSFIEHWNIVEQAVVFIKDYYREPLSVYLSRIASGSAGIAFAASCVYMAFPLTLLAMGQDSLEMGIELSGIK
jgi:multiple sugar transport system permease protein